MKPIIYINGRFLNQPATGVQRFALEVLNALDMLLISGDASLERAEWVCLVPRDVIHFPVWKFIRVEQVGKLKGNLWEQIELPFYARRGRLLNLCNIGPYWGKRQAVVLHDASVFQVPEAYSAAFRLKYRWVMKRLARRAEVVFTVSEFSRRELARFLNVPEARFQVVTEGHEHLLDVARDESLLDHLNAREKPYLLAVGSMSPHKNLTALIRALPYLDSLDFDVLVAGGSFPNVFQGVPLMIPPNVIRVGYVSDQQLRSLYENALCLVFPSLYEGFGLPPIEAMAFGCPVLTSDRASMPEICGEAALYFDPESPREIAERIHQIAKDEALRRSLQSAGARQIQSYRWEQTARQIAERLMAQLAESEEE